MLDLHQYFYEVVILVFDALRVVCELFNVSLIALAGVDYIVVLCQQFVLDIWQSKNIFDIAYSRLRQG